MKSSGNFTCHWCRISKYLGVTREATYTKQEPTKTQSGPLHPVLWLYHVLLRVMPRTIFECSAGFTGSTGAVAVFVLPISVLYVLSSLPRSSKFLTDTRLLWRSLQEETSSLLVWPTFWCDILKNLSTYTRTKKRHSDEKVVLDWTEPSAHPEKKVKRAFLDSSAEKASCFDSRTKRTKRRRISSSTGDSAMEMDGEKVASPEPSETSKREQRPRRKLLPATSTESSPQCKVSGTPSHSTQTLLKREVSVVIGSDAEILRDTVSTNPTDMNTSLESNPTASRDESPSESEEIEELAMQLLYSLSGVTTSVDRGSLGASQGNIPPVHLFDCFRPGR